MRVLVQAVLAVGPAHAGLAHARMEALHGLEVLAVDVGLAEVDLAHGLHGLGQVARVQGRGQAVFAVVGAGSFFMTFLAGNERPSRPVVRSAEGVLWRRCERGRGVGAGRVSAS